MQSTPAHVLPDRVLLGRVSGVFGVRGWVKVYSYTDPKENIVSYSPWFFQHENKWQPTAVLNGKPQGKTVVAQLEGINDRIAAEKLIGTDIFVTRDQLPKLAEDEYYWSDLEGLQVITESGASLGQVDYLIDTGANNVLVVKTESGKECLVPFISGQVVKSVDLQSGRITVDWSNEY